MNTESCDPFGKTALSRRGTSLSPNRGGGAPAFFAAILVAIISSSGSTSSYAALSANSIASFAMADGVEGRQGAAVAPPPRKAGSSSFLADDKNKNEQHHNGKHHGSIQFGCPLGGNTTRCNNHAGCFLNCNPANNNGQMPPFVCDPTNSFCNLLPYGWPFCVTDSNCGNGYVGGYAPYVEAAAATLARDLVESNGPL